MDNNPRTNELTNIIDQTPLDKITIRGIRSISTKEFEGCRLTLESLSSVV